MLALISLLPMAELAMLRAEVLPRRDSGVGPTPGCLRGLQRSPCASSWGRSGAGSWFVGTLCPVTLQRDSFGEP